MKKSTLIFGVAALVLLGSCSNPTGTSSAPAASSNGASSNQPTTSSAAPTSSTTPISSPSEQETYMVVITANSGIDDGLLDIAFKVVGFETLFIDNMGNTVPEVSNSATFTPNQLTKIRSLSRGKLFNIR